jgi:hypothetical protein
VPSARNVPAPAAVAAALVGVAVGVVSKSAVGGLLWIGVGAGAYVFGVVEGRPV